jgi:hypothetical protein
MRRAAKGKITSSKTNMSGDDDIVGGEIETLITIAVSYHVIVCKRTYANCNFHPGLFQGIEFTGKQ